MALTLPFRCSFNVRQAERKFLTWLFTFLVFGTDTPNGQ